MLSFILVVIISISVLYFAFKRGLIFLQIAQQDEYSPKSLWSWYKANLAFDRQATAVSITILIFSYFSKYYVLAGLLGSSLLYILSFFMIDPRYQAKLPLKITSRAQKVLQVFVLLLFLLWLVCLLVHGSCVPAFLFASVIILIQAVPFLVILSLKILEPFEKRLQLKFLKQAKEKIMQVNPKIIGITGSYGKTSVKNALGEVMQVTLGSTFWPPEGVNTLMGITRSIREELSTAHQFAVVEMAAYRQGSIAKLCELTPPQIGIITAIGNQHLERFGSLDITYQAKTELARAIPENGILICNADNALAKRAGFEYKKKQNIFYGFSEDIDISVRGKGLKNTLSGAEFNIEHQGKDYTVKTKLLGESAASNLLAVFAAAVSLGVSPELIIAAFANLLPVRNRLQLEKTKSAYWLHDAYNANEVGMLSALDVLDELEVSQKILITPGIIELGTEQEKINKQVAAKASEVADYIIVVGKVNRKAYQQGIENSEKLFIVDNREEAFNKLFEIKQENAIVLLSNDLSDFYEAKYRF